MITEGVKVQIFWEDQKYLAHLLRTECFLTYSWRCLRSDELEKLENIFLCRLFLAVNTHLKHQILQKWTICLETHAICYLLITCYIRLSDYIHKVFWKIVVVYQKTIHWISKLLHSRCTTRFHLVFITLLTTLAWPHF